ncbi:hypothetical protein [Gimesia chilikensis]|uniref:hypothetical protein n=1 Tax=Gimesia chilikensis TaxID=2605989 RepID=UPI0011A6C46D|nr:hypothetical protein [Gimesia chilikensis]
MSKLWLIKHQKWIKWEREIARSIGKKGHQQNETSNGREGGRIISRLISDYIEVKNPEPGSTGS